MIQIRGNLPSLLEGVLLIVKLDADKLFYVAKPNNYIPTTACIEFDGMVSIVFSKKLRVDYL